MVRLRLEGSAAIHIAEKVRPFNPTMVRLRLRLRAEFSHRPELSIPLWCDCDQICGIKMSEPRFLSIPLWCDCDKNEQELTPHPHNHISIPLWCDCDVRLKIGDKVNVGAISIPLWCDCDARFPPATESMLWISIPLWCDCDRIVEQVALPLLMNFNPTMVRLRPMLGSGTVNYVVEFQSHYGAIAT